MATIESNILLDQLSTEIQEIIDEANLRFNDLRINQLVWKPDDNVWGINEVLEHVNLFGRYYLVEIQNKLEQANSSEKVNDPLFRSGFWGNLITKSMGLDKNQNVKIKMKTGKGYDPSIDQIMNNEVFKEFINQHGQLLNLLDSSRTINLKKIKISIPFFKILKLRLGDCFAFMVAHNKRHLVQAKRVIEFPGFPN